ncbi:MAG: DUF421 domain-containing protein, partial [Pedobacter sp.]
MAIVLQLLLFKDFETILLGDKDWNFIPEIMLRTLIMFLIVLFSLRVLGKRGVKQLSVFELVVIISLGSAAGDPMFYQEVGILAAFSVFFVVVIAYKITSYFVGKSKKVEELLEGSCTCLIEDGKFSVHNFQKESLAQDEFFSELRLKSVSHLGQVKLAIIETSGSVSLFFYKDGEVKMGLPILPSLFDKKSNLILTDGPHACCFCGHVEELTAGKSICKVCNKEEWV